MKGFIEIERIISEHTIQTESINIKTIIKFYGYFSTDEVFWGKRDFCKIVFEGGKEIRVAETYEEIKQKIKEAQEQK